MLAKVAPKTNAAQGVKGFSQLSVYIANREHIDHETGEISNRRVSTKTNCLSDETAAHEMRAVADANGRVKDPVYHVVLSWRAGENPTDEQMFSAGDHAMKAVGMDGHQYLFAVHRDTDNAHLHMMVNRVHHETGKAVYPDRDFYKLDYAMRELEIAQGWQPDKGPNVTVERNGNIFIERANNQVKQQEKQPTKARDMEVSTGGESLFSYARGEPRKAIVAALKRDDMNWQGLHDEMGRHGLEIRPKGQGFAVYSRADDGQTPIKASDMHESLSKARLEKRLGAFVEPIRAVKIREPERVYTKHREVKRDAGMREQKREERAQARRDLRARYDAYRDAFKASRKADKGVLSQRMKGVGEGARVRRSLVRASNLSPAARKALYSSIAFEAVKARELVRAEWLSEQQAPNNRAQAYRDWVADRAQEGDAAAVSQLRGWAYSDKRLVAEMERAEAGREKDGVAVAPGRQRHDPAAPRRLIERMTWQVNRSTGDVAYRVGGETLFTDTGRTVAFSRTGSNDDEALAAGLALARQKFGQEITLSGPDEFKQRAIKAMVDRKMDIRLTDPALESQRLQAIGERNRQERDRAVGRHGAAITREHVPKKDKGMER